MLQQGALVARGGYNGGSTLIGFGRGGMYDPEFDRPAVKAGRRLKSSFHLPAPEKTTLDPVVMPGGKNLTRKQRRALLQNVERDRVLSGLNRPLPKMLPNRQKALKKLLADKILLQSGQINFDHPEVAAWVRSNGKKSKKND